MKVALLVPTRDRPGLQERLMRSILLTTENIESVHLYLGVDDDDPSRGATEELVARPEYSAFTTIVPIHNDGEFMGLGYNWNCCWRAIRDEEIISMIGDDMIFRTKGWDVHVLRRFAPENMPSDNIKMVHVNDGHQGRRLAVNAFLHRRYAEINGYFMREEFRINWVDQWLHQMFDCFGRLEYLPFVLIEHDHWVFGHRDRDRNGERMMEFDRVEGMKISDMLWNRLAPQRLEEVNRLMTVMNLKPDWRKVDLRGAFK